MSRNFVTSRLEDNSVEMEKVRELFSVIPAIEPANGGPDDDEFLQAMEESLNSKVKSAFPDPYFTACGQYSSKR